MNRFFFTPGNTVEQLVGCDTRVDRDPFDAACGPDGRARCFWKQRFGNRPLPGTQRVVGHGRRRFSDQLARWGRHSSIDRFDGGPCCGGCPGVACEGPDGPRCHRRGAGRTGQRLDRVICRAPLADRAAKQSSAVQDVSRSLAEIDTVIQSWAVKTEEISALGGRIVRGAEALNGRMGEFEITKRLGQRRAPSHPSRDVA